jgi:hypothetical protein
MAEWKATFAALPQGLGNLTPQDIEAAQASFDHLKEVGKATGVNNGALGDKWQSLLFSYANPWFARLESLEQANISRADRVSDPGFRALEGRKRNALAPALADAVFSTGLVLLEIPDDLFPAAKKITLCENLMGRVPEENEALAETLVQTYATIGLRWAKTTDQKWRVLGAINRLPVSTQFIQTLYSRTKESFFSATQKMGLAGRKTARMATRHEPRSNDGGYSGYGGVGCD